MPRAETLSSRQIQQSLREKANEKVHFFYRSIITIKPQLKTDVNGSNGSIFCSCKSLIVRESKFNEYHSINKEKNCIPLPCSVADQGFVQGGGVNILFCQNILETA